MGSLLHSLIFQPPVVSYSSDSNLVWFTTKSHVNIPAIFIDNKAQLTFLVSHANAEDIGLIFQRMILMSVSLDVNMLLYEYEGYGKCGTFGKISEGATYEDIDAAFDYLINAKHIIPSNIILYGRSLGCGPSCYLAEKLSLENIHLAGMILLVRQYHLFSSFNLPVLH